MSLANASALTFWLGLLGLFALLFALQCLRVRYRRLEVVTALFWKEAIEESRARVLLRRFRHPWAFLLALAVVGLIWLAWAEPVREDWGDAREMVMLIDGSAGMAVGDGYEEAVDLLQRELRGLATENRRVFWCGADTRLLLDRGEENLLLAARMKALSVEASPGSFEGACLSLTRELAPHPMTIVLIGEAPVSDEVLALLPGEVVVKRLSDGQRQVVENHGIRALGLAGSMTDYEAVDVYFRTTPGAAYAVDLGGQPCRAEATRVGDGGWVLGDVPAQGNRLTVRLSDGDALASDNEATIQLPRRERLRVSLGEETPEVVRRLLRADMLVEIVESAAEVVVGETSDSLPSLSWSPAGEEAFVFLSDEEELEIEGLFAELGMDHIDASGLAEQTGRVIRMRVEPGERKQIHIWESLLSGDFNFTQSAAFPLFMAKALRWLGEEDAVDPYVAVGERHPRLTVAGSPYAPPRVGEYRDDRGMARTAFLAGDPLGGTDQIPRVTTLQGAVAGFSAWVTWLILAALTLLVLEWTLFKRGRIP